MSGTREKSFIKVGGIAAVELDMPAQGVNYSYYEDDWNFVPGFDSLKSIKSGVLSNFDFSPRNNEEYFGFRYTGFIKIPKDGVYNFFTKSDDGSQLFIGEKMVVDNDGLHGAYEQGGAIPLRTGFHPITVTFFEKTGDDVLEVFWKGPGVEKERIPESVLFYTE